MPLTAIERTERAKKAAAARWESRYDFDHQPLEEAFKQLTFLRAEAERGGLILQQRSSNNQVQKVECYNPDCCKGPEDSAGHHSRTVIDIGSGRFAGYRTRHNLQTGAIETAYACSAACYLYMSSHFTHASASPRDVSPTIEEPEVVLNEAAKNIV